MEITYFLGLEAHRNSKGLHLFETKYAIDLLIKTNMINANLCSTPIVVGVKLFARDNKPFEDPILYR